MVEQHCFYSPVSRRRGIIEAPTGVGKTAILARFLHLICKTAQSAGGHTQALVVVPNITLVDQVEAV